MSKRKLAMLWSGQTRTYDYTVWDSMLNLYSDYDIDHYGHTWDYCDDPYNVNDFKFFKKTNQKVISEWLERNPKWKQNFDNYDNTHVYAQVWGFLECLKLLEHNDYDLIVRTRWDTKGVYAQNSYEVRDYQDRINWVLTKHSDYKVIYGSEILVGEKMVMSKVLPYVGDIHFIMCRKYATHLNETVDNFITTVREKDIPVVLNKWQRERDPRVLCLNHSLWVDFLLNQDFSIYGALGGHCWELKR